MTAADPEIEENRPTDVQRAVLSVRGLEVDYPSEHGTVRAVRGVSFDLRPGTTLGIVGESGSGKSAASLAVMGLQPRSAAVRGSVQLDGREILNLNDRAMSSIRGRELGMIFQDPLSALTPVFTIGQQLAEALDAHQDLTSAQVRKRSVELLDLVGIAEPERRLKNYPHQFSGGMRQRVMIAIAIANDPKVIIADEPTTALDVTVQAQILDVLKAARKETGAAVVMITHDLGVVAGMADDVVIMYAGRAVEHGTAEQVFQRPQMPYTMGLFAAVPRPDQVDGGALVPIEGAPPSPIDMPGGCPFAPRCPMAIELCTREEPRLRDQQGSAESHYSACHRAERTIEENLTHRDIYPVPQIPPAPHGNLDRQERDEVLQVSDLRKHFTLSSRFLRRNAGTVKAVDGVSFDIRRGETLALAGESGCGKTTTLLEIMRLKEPTSGHIVVMGQDVGRLRAKERRQIRSDLQIVFQDPMSSFDPRMPVYDLLAEPLHAQGWKTEPVNERIGELLDLVGLNSDHVDRFAEQLSSGQRQRIAIARALAVEPALIVLDEPVAALDVSTQAAIVNLLKDLQARLEVSFLFVAHDLSVVRHVADRVAVMYLGRIIEIGNTEQVFTRPRHPYTAALLSAAPVPDPGIERRRERTILSGDVPSAMEETTGCRFRNRCPKYQNLTVQEQILCATDEPSLIGEAGVKDQEQACHYPI